MTSATRRDAPRVMLVLPSRLTGSDVQCGHCGVDHHRGMTRSHDTTTLTHGTVSMRIDVIGCVR
jgi:hypothetical protein